MAYFSADSVQELSISGIEAITASIEIQTVTKRLQQLHEKLYAQMKLQNLNLHILTPNVATVIPSSVSTVEDGGALCVAYLRQATEAVMVERLMGREEVASVHKVEAHRHPVIEIRLGSDGLAVELILSPDAWWDQQNLAGKLGIARHRQEFYAMLQQLASDYRMGFWRGTHLSEMHLTANQFQHPRIMDEWMSTFEPGADWWRMGVWFDYDDDALSEDEIDTTLLKNIRSLYGFYDHMRWTGDNNYREFYAKAT
ncbi:MAG: hypothetical protein Q9P44_15650 [Anaerolineae bacterium]|nr:hypothetical protein [Anaerolineae bacterium]